MTDPAVHWYWVCVYVNKSPSVHVCTAQAYAVSFWPCVWIYTYICISTWIIHIFDFMYISNSSWMCLISHIYDNGDVCLCDCVQKEPGCSYDLKPGQLLPAQLWWHTNLHCCRQKSGRYWDKMERFRDGWRKVWRGRWKAIRMVQ